MHCKCVISKHSDRRDISRSTLALVGLCNEVALFGIVNRKYMEKRSLKPGLTPCLGF